MKLLVWWLLAALCVLGAGLLAALCVLGAGLLAGAGTLLLAGMPSVLPRLSSLSPGALLLLLPAPLLLLYLWRLLGAPLEILRAPEEVGYLPEPGRSLAQTASMVQRRRKKGDLPPVYPNGWYQLLLSRELPPGGARTATLLGEQVAVYRTQGGRVYVVDAYCPHLGANLAVGGRVVGDCIECPFHGWQFHGEDGKCTHVPYAEKVPDFAKIKTWPSCEVNDMIFVWYHCDGIEPAWKVPEQQKITSKEWVYRGRTEHFVNAHIEEIPENAADVAHLSFLHEPGIVTGTDLRYTKSKMWDFVKHGWKVQWIPELPPNKHCSQMLLVHELLLFGKHLPVLDFHVVARQIGPGIVHLTFKHSFLGTGVLLHTVTPLEPLMQKVTHLMYYQRSIPALIPKLILKAECIQFERDVMVWNNKKFVSKPLLLKEDAAVGRHRRWFSQFYTENSPRFSFQQDGLDW